MLSAKLHGSLTLQTLEKKITINCGGRIISLQEPLVMGIINATPDSFWEGSRLEQPEDILRKAEKMLSEGAVFVDVGGYSARPGASEVTTEEELKRVIPAIELIARNLPELIISVDTFRSKVAREACNAGAGIVNDISAGDDDPEMIETVGALQVPYIAMHKKGMPATMQQNPIYDDVVKEVMDYFSIRLNKYKSAGIKDVIVDPGFGFGKTVSHNYTLLNALSDFSIFRLPLLVGLSRKTMIRHITGTNEEDALNGTTVLNTIAIQKGASILRVHDVKEAVEIVKLVKAVRR